MFTMVTKIEQSRDPLYIIPAFTGELLKHRFMLASPDNVGKHIMLLDCPVVPFVRPVRYCYHDIS